MHRARGFTLLELIIVTGIFAILAALATAAYTRYALRSHRSDAHQVLLGIANDEERWYATYNRYTADLGKFGFDDIAMSPNGYYQVSLSVEADSAQTFVVLATPVRAQAGDACGSLSIDSRGRKFPARNDAQANADGFCW
ncbi:type IV pilin protein [Dyella mobilis]|uniref:Prepilin-type N-terminal cleavage/methylation domain-containing protein n=1 Tax=Dyella mobilis TaxID=1849582 RepID=A0ABS2KK19_9GAMM|nr:type IV pilin protein [Dyella mobilis]MBM7131511.1 prepilin-type N-terminal cleavage/methylation domain-containing protein [Dyella mobilis]GLQ96518.1 type 4 fimbrial biogenesis protein PilE [Dyella mobilis]